MKTSTREPIPANVRPLPVQQIRDYFTDIDKACAGPPPKDVDPAKWTELIEDVRRSKNAFGEALRNRYVHVAIVRAIELAELVTTLGVKVGEIRFRTASKIREPFVDLATAALRDCGSDAKPKIVKAWLKEKRFVDPTGEKVRSPANPGGKNYQPITIKTFAETYVPLARKRLSECPTIDDSRVKTRQK